MNSFVGTDGLHFRNIPRTAEKKIKYLGVCVSIDRSVFPEMIIMNETKRNETHPANR
jgi:hypothetical protein